MDEVVHKVAFAIEKYHPHFINFYFLQVDKLCNSLSIKLGANEYFYGNDNPCELDALVFGHLFCIFTIEGIVLGETINKYKNLTAFCFKMEKKFFDAKN